MGLFLDRVKQTTNTTGTGDLTLLPPSATYQSFSVFGDGQQAAYVIAHPTLNQWEVGIGTVHTAGPTLTRTTVLAGSNGTSKVNFSEGTKVVGNPLPASFANQVSTIRNGSGVPSNSLGNDGDYYIRTTTNDLYYKSSGSYSIISRLGGTITLTGDATATGTGSIAVTLATVNSNVGTFSKVTVNAKGLVTAATNIGSSDVTTALGFTPIDDALLGAGGGVATLDGAGHLPTSQLPPGLLGGINPVGTWDADANDPTLASGVGTEGDLYLVSEPGTTDLDGFNSWNLLDGALFAGGSWHRIPGSSGTVTSLSIVTANGISGTVSNPTTAPAVTLSLGNITPISVTASGNVLGSNLSGTNTGDQTITLTGDATGAGTGTFAVTLATVNSDIGEFNKVTVNAKGLVTSAANMTDDDIIATLGYTPADEAMVDQPDGIAPLDSDGLVPTWNLPPFGTVTSVSIVTAHGISGSVATDTTTPAITLTLGAITPSSVAATGNVTGLNLSGTNTGDQTITLTGDVTGSGTGSFAATLATVNTNIGTFSKVTVNGKGLVTAASNIGSLDVTTALGFTPIDVATKGVANGVASLDSSGKVPSSQLPSGGGGGSGTVTTVSVVTANGVSGSVANATSTPAITLTLGAITPTSVAASGNVSGSNLSGTNTGDQTITLTGDVTGTGTGSFAATLATVNSNVGTFSKLTVNAKGLVTAATNLTATDISLGNVTNDAQTKAAIVPNTAPSAGQVLIGNSGGTAYAKQTISGSGATITLSDAGLVTISAIANASLSNSAITIAGTSTSLGGSISLDTITGLSSTGLIKRTGANTLATAASGTDYAPATSGSSILYGNGAGGFSNVTVGATLSFSAGTIGIDLTNANTWTAAQTFQRNNIGVTSTDGPVKANTQAATNVLDQWSPRDRWLAHYYSGGDKTSEWIFENQAGMAAWSHNDNGAGFGSSIMTLSKTSVLTVANVSSSNSVTAGRLVISTATNDLSWTGGGSITSPAANAIQIGPVDAASPSAQTLSAQSVVTGTSNTAGQNFTIAGSKGTGTGVGGSIVFQVSPGTSTGSTPNALVTALTIAPFGTNSSSVTFNNTGDFTIGAGSRFILGSSRAILTSPTSNQIQLGGSDGSGANAQMFRVQSIGLNTTNGSGADFTFRQSTPTGTGTPGNYIHAAGFSGLTTTPTVTITNASPAVFTVANHGFVPGQVFKLTTTGSLPTGLSSSSTYYVLATNLTANTFTACVTNWNSAAVNTSSAGSGTHTLNCQTNVPNPETTTITMGPSGLTGSTATPVLNVQQYWNTSGTPQLIKANAIDLASNAASLLLDLQTNSVDKFTVDKSGNTYIAGKVTGYLAGVVTKTGSYTFTAADSGQTFRYNSASGGTFTLPNSLPEGWNVRVIQTSTGQATFSAASGATLQSASSYTKTRAQWAEVDLVVDANSGGSAAEYVLGGDGAT